ncbi:hypothetical protein DID88_006709 [Monilinia fructigena]|uniref:Uncharacterized protein n=1 Tax=Monilinia fructigena TaxID=38457 RepID=A0A395IIH9_9HELO|nr:hypothetical protein DID88_006709 [Monilinia fructigena]
MPGKNTVLPAALTGLFIDIGRWPNFLLDFPIISLDTTQLKDEILQSSNFKFAITDVLNLYFQTQCEGNYISIPSISPKLKNLTCSAPSPNVEFLPANIIHLQLSKLNSSEAIQLSAYNFAHQLGEIQRKFATSYHAELHTTFLIYVSALCFGGIILFLALVSCWNDKASWIAGVFSILTAIFLLIGNSIITTFQTQAVKTINKYGQDVGIMGYRGTGLLVLIWTAFAVAFVAAVAWGWGVWINGRDDNSIQGSNHGGVYIQCHRDPGEIELARLVNLEVRREGVEGR